MGEYEGDRWSLKSAVVGNAILNWKIQKLLNQIGTSLTLFWIFFYLNCLEFFIQHGNCPYFGIS